MYPSIVDMNENESSKCLRMLELDAFANMLAALRAQGPPTSDKLKLLKDIGTALRIPQERCKAEIRKAILDERLNTIAYFACGQLETADEWIKEGRRLISLMPRVSPHTIYSAIADEVADAASITNEQLPLPSMTDRKRPNPITQVQQTVPESLKSQPFRTPDSFNKNDDKKRKMPFGVENSTLAQHLVGPSKMSRIQHIYRQKAKTKAKEMQAKMKQQEQEQPEFRHMHPQPRVFQAHHFQSRVQKVPLSVQPTTSISPKINILQNISIQPPNRGEETIEQIKNEINSFMIQKPSELAHNSPQPSCSNENQAPKQQKQTIVNIKPNTNITYKHVASPGPSSEFHKSIKLCTTRKPVTKTVPGQKLIIVSNAQSMIAPASILQRTLSIPFIKNISVKNFDKFKIVSTSANTSNVQLTSLVNAHTSTFTTSSAKHKVVTVRTNSATKKMIPLAHLHALNAKGSIKMLPVGGKILSKATLTATNSTPPLCLINSTSGLQQAHTKSTTSTPVMVSCRPQEPMAVSTKDDETILVEDLSNPETSVVVSESNQSTNPSSHTTILCNNPKSTVLADILKASGVITSENESFVDIESRITQYAIPQSVSDSVRTVTDEVQVNQDFEVVETVEGTEIGCFNEEVANNSNVTSSYISLAKDRDTDRLLKDLEGEDSSDLVIGNLDPGTGEYTIETSVSHCDGEIESSVLDDDTFMVEMQKATNLPDINAVN